MSTTSRSIFDIDQELDQIAQGYDLIAEQPEVEESIKESIIAYFGNLMEERDAKLDRYADLIAFRETAAAARKAEAKRIADLAKTDEATVKSLKRLLLAVFGMHDISKMETRLHKFWTQANGGKTPVLLEEGIDPEQVDPRFRRVKYEIDNDAVREALESGEEIAWARLGERGTSLRIK